MHGVGGRIEFSLRMHLGKIYHQHFEAFGAIELFFLYIKHSRGLPLFIHNALSWCTYLGLSIVCYSCLHLFADSMKNMVLQL
ncbi:hypothetical protein BGZ63DRAFT_103053 [Mariannaea sp. PMI_226]|nr:hypothetical protein BGZ63DRAFT_103053 [Mariannaea sp. PMI_226]